MSFFFSNCCYDCTHGCHGQTKLDAIGPAHGTCCQQAMYGIIMFATACFCCDTFTKALPGVFKVAVYWKVQEGLVRVKAEWKVHTKLSSKRNEGSQP